MSYTPGSTESDFEVMDSVPAVILAGDRKASKLIEHENKAFLVFRGEPLFIHVLRALRRTESVGKVVVVGPGERLARSIAASDIQDADDVGVVEQGSDLLDNAKLGFVRTLPEEVWERSFGELRNSVHRDRCALFLSCDIPLITPYEIDEFVRSSDMERFDYSLGLTPERALTHYYPTVSTPGIRMVYYHLREGRCRHNNLHLGKPLRATRLWYIERMYELRYQTQWYNMAWTFLLLVSTGKMLFPTLRHYLRLQKARSLYDRGRPRRYERVRARASLDDVIACMQTVLGFRMQATFTHYGGATLDVDNADHLAIAEKMADAWASHQESTHRRLANSG